MKKILLALTLLFSLTFPAVAAAQFDPLDQACDANTNDASVCQTDGTNNPISGSNGIILRVVNILSYVVGVASVIMVIFGGLKYITASGDSNNISAARNAILFAMIGVAVFLIAQLIIRFVLSRI